MGGQSNFSIELHFNSNGYAAEKKLLVARWLDGSSLRSGKSANLRDGISLLDAP
jgi:hypothetical protein